MRSLLSHAPGGPDSLKLTDVPVPSPGPGEVRIAVRAAGVNLFDTLIIRDRYQLKPPRPFAPGGEVSGFVDAVGDGVEGVETGDRVLAYSSFGGFAELAVCPQTQVFRLPDGMPYDEAACLLITYGTSHYALHDRGGLKAGETLLILGAAGGVGAAAIELGKAAGARVIAGVSNRSKADFCTGLGADEVIVYPRDIDRDAQKALAADIKSLAGPMGVDVVYDAIGGDYAEPALRTLGWGGRYLVVGFAAGIPKMPLNLTLLKSCQIVGVYWGAFTEREPERHRQLTGELFELYLAGMIKPVIDERYPLERAADALMSIENRTARGKIAITVKPRVRSRTLPEKGRSRPGDQV